MGHIVKNLKLKTVEPFDTIVREGDSGSLIYILIKGSAMSIIS